MVLVVARATRLWFIAEGPHHMGSLRMFHAIGINGRIYDPGTATSLAQLNLYFQHFHAPSCRYCDPFAWCGLHSPAEIETRHRW